MTGPLYRLGGFVARRAPWVLAAWLVFVVAVVLVASATGRPTSNDTTIPGSDSERATKLLENKLPSQANGSVPIVLKATSGTLADNSNQTAVENAVSSLKKNQYVSEAVSPYSEQGAGSISTTDPEIGFISLVLKQSSDDLNVDEANSILDSADPAKKAGIEVSAGGYLGTELSQPSTRLSETIGILAAIPVLLLAFGLVAAMPMPLTTAILGLLGGLAVLGLLGTGIQVPSISPTLGAMLGLGVGIDYSLFITTRHLRLLESGHPPKEAVARAVATSGGAVVFAGSTVIIALLCLYFGGIPIVSQLGYSTAIVVAVVIVAALTLLPAMLSLLGTRILRFPVRGVRRPGVERGGGRPHGSARWAQLLSRHPIIAALTGIILFVVLAIPVLDIRLGAQDSGQLPESTTLRKAYDELRTGFGVGVNGPLQVAVDLKPAGTESLESLEALQAAMQSTSDVSAVTASTVNDAGTAAVFAVIPSTSPSAEKTQKLVKRLRNKTVPEALEGTELKAYIGGTTAANIDLADKITDRLPIVIAIIFALSVLLLAVAFRTIVVPLIGAAVNLLAVAASYGVITAVFEKGWLVTVIGLDHEIPVVSFVPLLMFAILFGLSMDYTVFLLTRMREAYDRTGDPRRAVVDGLGITGRVILSAASIMILVFASFIINGDPTVKQFGVGLAVAIAAAGIGVLMIVPALVLLVGRAAWWLPGPVERHLPNIGIEGEEFFERLDAAGAAGGSRAANG